MAPKLMPRIPEYITVHLGSPDSNATNVTVSFIDYIKNVASSEIYPTWEEAALRANILAQISFALNRVYTEYYRSRGKDFDITSSTAIDQKYIYGRNTFDTTDRIVEEIFNDYIRRIQYIEPLAAKYCNGTTVTCDGLSQWGSEFLAREGYDFMQILYNYYGYDITIVQDAPIEDIPESYPGYPIRLGMTGVDVLFVQTILNRVSVAYPSIPKVALDSIFGEQTDEAVRTFQSVFNLTPDGIVGRATWYKMVQMYTGLKRLSELNTDGLAYSAFNLSYPDAISVISTGQKVYNLQYLLSVIAFFDPRQPPVRITGNFDQQTLDAVLAYQRNNDLPITGVVNAETWNSIYDTYAGIVKSQASNLYRFTLDTFPYSRDLTLGSTGEDVRLAQEQLNFLSLTYPGYNAVKVTGTYDEQTQQAVSVFQHINGLRVTGDIDRDTWNLLQSQYYEAVSEIFTSPYQFPYKEIRDGDTDSSLTKGYVKKNNDPQYYYHAKPITSLQTYLRFLAQQDGLPTIIPSGVYDKETKNLVEIYQSKNNLPITGVVNKATWDSIVSDYENRNKKIMEDQEKIIIGKINESKV